MFKTPGKLRGKTPHTTRKRMVAEPRQVRTISQTHVYLVTSSSLLQTSSRQIFNSAQRRLSRASERSRSEAQSSQSSRSLRTMKTKHPSHRRKRHLPSHANCFQKQRAMTESILSIASITNTRTSTHRHGLPLPSGPLSTRKTQLSAHRPMQSSLPHARKRHKLHSRSGILCTNQ